MEGLIKGVEFGGLVCSECGSELEMVVNTSCMRHDFPWDVYLMCKTCPRCYYVCSAKDEWCVKHIPFADRS